MTYEIVVTNPYENASDFTVADGSGIEKGTLLKLTDPKTAIKSSAAGDVCAGVAAREKIASDGRTRLAVYRNFEGLAYISGAAGVGQPLMSAGVDNMLKLVTTAAQSGAAIVGYALETASDAEQILVRFKL